MDRNRGVSDGGRSEPGAPIAARRVDQLPAFADYLASFRDVFVRADQAGYFALYLRGVLNGGHRKNIESIAAHLRMSDPTAADLAQALNHFVSKSPWDADRLMTRYRAALRQSMTVGRGTLVVHDGVFPKAGRYSAGAQRQFARSLGRKVNCQLAVVVAHFSPTGYFPLATRLYLPANWVRENPAAVARTIPRDNRFPVGKVEIALELIDQLLAEGWPVERVAAEDGYAGSAKFQNALASRHLANASVSSAENQSGPVALARGRFDWLKEHLGLDHFEGRTWVGWHHHVSLVIAAYGFLATLRLSDQLPPFPDGPSDDWSI